MNTFSAENIKMVTDFANEEYLKFAKKMFTDFKGESEIYIGLPKNNEVRLDEWKDEIYIDVKNGKGVITGSNPGSVVIAMYRFLKECGCYFVRPGKDGDYIPETTLSDKVVFVSEKATSEKRCMIIEGACKFENVYNMIEFCPKVGLNTYEFQFLSSTPFFERWYTHKNNPLREDEKIDKAILNAEEVRLKKEVVRRGMKLQTMGHGFTAYPIGLFPNGWGIIPEENIEAARPYLALYNGKRELIKGSPFLSNLCYSQPEVQEKMANYMVQYCKENPDVSIVKFALSDNINTACECENCKDHRMSDLVIRVLNRTDEKMTEAGLTQRICILAYQDTLWAPREEKIKNLDRFYIGFYPISRVYHSPLPTENIPEEEPYPFILNKLKASQDSYKLLAHLKDWQRSVDKNAKWIIGEYHFMWAHYLDIGYQQISEVLCNDIKNQEKLGLVGLEMYQSQRCAFPTAMGLHAMGETLWNKNVSFKEISKEYFKNAYGNNWEQALNYLQSLSDTYDTKIRQGGRDYKALDCIPVMEKCLKMVDDFEEIRESIKDESTPLTKTSWGDPALRNDYIKRYFGAVLTGLKGEAEKGQEQINELVAWLWSIEPQVQERWDITIECNYTPVWYKRIIEIKANEARNAKASDIVVGGAGSEGIQG